MKIRTKLSRSPARIIVAAGAVLFTNALFAADADEKAPERQLPHVLIEAKFVEMPDAVARELLRMPGLFDQRLPNQARVSLFTEEQMELMIRSLNQRKGVDLVSAPRVTMNSGQHSTIEIIREFRFATAWDPADQKNKPWTPTAFETRNVGVTLEAKATVNDDDTLALHLVPQVVEFLGFVEGGTRRAIAAAKQDPKQPLMRRLLESPTKGDATPGRPNSPVFSTRKIESDVTLLSGQSMILSLGASQDTKPFVSPHAGRTLIAIVTASLVAPDAAAPPPAPPAPAAPAPPAGDSLLAVPVEGKPGFVRSPYALDAGYIDVRGFPSGTEVKDPYSGKVFRVP